MKVKGALSEVIEPGRGRPSGKWRTPLKFAAYALSVTGAVTLSVIAMQLTSAPLTTEAVESIRSAVSVIVGGLMLGALAYWDAEKRTFEANAGGADAPHNDEVTKNVP